MVINEWLRVDCFIRDFHAVLGRVHVCAVYLKCFHIFPQSTLVFGTKLDSVPPCGLCLFPLKDFEVVLFFF